MREKNMKLNDKEQVSVLPSFFLLFTIRSDCVASTAYYITRIAVNVAMYQTTWKDAPHAQQYNEQSTLNKRQMVATRAKE